MADKPEKITEQVVMTVVRGPESYATGGFAVRIKGISQIAQELSGEHKVSVAGVKTSGGFIAHVTSGAISGNVATVKMLWTTSGGAEVADATNLSGIEVVLIATGY